VKKERKNDVRTLAKGAVDDEGIRRFLPLSSALESLSFRLVFVFLGCRKSTPIGIELLRGAFRVQLLQPPQSTQVPMQLR
jgi:hypothetical protein